VKSTEMRRVVILSIAIMVSVQGQTQSAGTATTSGTCAVANTGNENIFKIDCGIGKEQGQKILAVLNKILSKKLDLDAVIWRLDEIGIGLEAIKEKDTLRAAQLDRIEKGVAEIQHGNPSGKVLLKVTADLTDNLRQFPYTWKDSVHEVDLYRDEFFMYHQPPMTNKAEIDAANKFLDEKLKEANSKRRNELHSLLQAADTLCESLLGNVSQQTAEDKTKRQEIGRLMQSVWTEEAYGSYSTELNSLADYLDHLAKRVASGEA
jgi:hypothetical protein